MLMVETNREDFEPDSLEVDLVMSCQATTATVLLASSSTKASARRWNVARGTSFTHAVASLWIHCSTSSSKGSPVEHANAANAAGSSPLARSARRITAQM